MKWPPSGPDVALRSPMPRLRSCSRNKARLCYGRWCKASPQAPLRQRIRKLPRARTPLVPENRREGLHFPAYAAYWVPWAAAFLCCH